MLNGSSLINKSARIFLNLLGDTVILSIHIENTQKLTAFPCQGSKILHSVF